MQRRIMIRRQVPNRLSRWLAASALLAAAPCSFPSPQNCADRSMVEAARAIRQAEVAIAQAAKAGSLWLNAEQALERARSALARREPGLAACAAVEAGSFAVLGIQQLQYPPYRAISGDQP